MQKQIRAATALLALLVACGGMEGEAFAGGQHPVSVPPPLPGRSSLTHDLATGERVYRSTCSLCHRLGLKGAPRLGDREDWAVRLAQGGEVLYSRAIGGYRGRKGSMPSRGSNAKLSDDEVRAAVDYMVRYSVPASRGLLGSHVFSATAKQFTIRQP